MSVLRGKGERGSATWLFPPEPTYLTPPRSPILRPPAPEPKFASVQNRIPIQASPPARESRAGTCHRTTSCYTMQNRAGTRHRAADLKPSRDMPPHDLLLHHAQPSGDMPPSRRPQTERGHKPGLHLKQLRRSPTPLPGTKQCGAALRYDAPGVCMPPRAPWCARAPFITPDIPTHTRLEREGGMPNTKRSPCKTFSATDAVGGGWQHAMPSTIDLQAWIRKSNGIPD